MLRISLILYIFAPLKKGNDMAEIANRIYETSEGQILFISDFSDINGNEKVVKECLRTLFVNDASAARPDGSMEVVKLFWWQHNCKDGQYSSAKVHRSVKVTLKDSDQIPSSVDDYAITVEALPGLEPEVIDGL